MKPPYSISNTAHSLSIEIAEIIGHMEGVQSRAPQTELRKQNLIRTIQGSLSIEGNTLSVSQITAILENKQVIGPAKDIAEVINAVAAYKHLSQYRFDSTRSMLKAHKYLMNGLIEEAGSFRKGSVGILKGKEVAHIAPPPSRVPELINNLFSYLRIEKETHILIKSCVFHYELMFIHPFSDGNGRIGRLWQTVILMEYHPIFEFLPIESLIKENQQSYYQILGECDSRGDSTMFIEFLLGLISISLKELKDSLVVEAQTAESRLNLAKKHFDKISFSRKNYLLLHKTISSATASRDLKLGVDSNILLKAGEKSRTEYNFK
ncbi:MAG: Fic family protein [Pseudomonadales bacterium]|nr:Fic family protein [Pseudomonadales bacterium]